MLRRAITARSAAAIASALCVALHAASALAQSAPWAWPPPPPEVAPPPPPGAYYHGGFYLRGSVGVAFAHAELSGNDGRQRTANGVGEAWDFALGGAIGEGLMLALDVGSSAAIHPATSSAGLTRVQLLRWLAVFDYYPRPHGGMHVQSGLGFGVASTDSGPSAEYGRSSGLGLALHVGAGWERWVSEQWSMGVLLRVDYCAAGSLGLDDGPGHEFGGLGVFTPALLLTATYN